MHQIYQHSPLLILEARLDWLSATVKPGQKQQVVRGRVAKWIDDQVALGNDRRSFVTPFYTGERTRGIALGERRDDNLITLSGEMAHQHGPTLITWADNVSRIDIQVTLIEQNLNSNWAQYVDELYAADARVKSGQLTTRLYSQRPRGITSYIGEGGSDKMCRVYDKNAESKGVYPLGAWRWEVQYRHKRAGRVAEHLLDGSFLPGNILEAVCNAYSGYHVYLPVDSIPEKWRDTGPASYVDDDRRLLWLQTSVAPCVEKLVDHYGSEVVLAALGLDAITGTLESQREEIKAMAETIDRQLVPADSLQTKGLVQLQ